MPDINWDGTVHSYRPAADWKTRISSAVTLHSRADEEIDPVTYEVIRHRLWTINMAHGETVTRVSGSPVFQSLDFNMCILTEDAEYVMNAPFIQFLNSGAGFGIRYILEHFSGEPGIEPSDLYVANDPWIGAVHEMDVLFAQPVFVADQLFAWVANAGHQYDLGGIVPGGWPQNAEDVYSDPTIFSPFKLVERGTIRKDLEAMYLRQSRMPQMVALDMRAQIAGCRFAAEQIVELCTEFGPTVVKGAMHRILDNAQLAFRAKLKRIPDGTWSEARYVDERLPGDRGTYRIQVNITKRGDRLIIDNSGTEPQAEGPLGFTLASFTGSILSPISVTMLHEQLFALGGADRQIDYRPSPGLLTCVDHPAAVGAGVLNVLCHMAAVQTCIDRMLTTDAELALDVVAPSPDYPVPVISGRDDRGRYYGSAILDHYSMGLGARSDRDGVDTGGPAWSPLTFLLNVEDVEEWYPLIYLWRRELIDSGGAGRWRGGSGLAYAWTPYRAESMKMACFGGGMCVSTHGAEGICGGLPSPSAHVKVFRATNLGALLSSGFVPNHLEQLEAQESFSRPQKANDIGLDDGDVVEGVVVGGGGFGDPLLREPARVADDVQRGYVSPDAAARAYGVALAADGSVYEPRTRQLRGQIRQLRSAVPAVPAAPTAVLMPATGEPERKVHDAICARDEAGRRVLACLHCKTVLCGYRDDFKRHLLLQESPISEIPGSLADPADFLDEAIVLRRYYCPACQAQLAVDVARQRDEPWPDMILT